MYFIALLDPVLYKSPLKIANPDEITAITPVYMVLFLPVQSEWESFFLLHQMPFVPFLKIVPIPNLLVLFKNWPRKESTHVTEIAQKPFLMIRKNWVLFR